MTMNVKCVIAKVEIENKQCNKFNIEDLHLKSVER